MGRLESEKQSQPGEGDSGKKLVACSSFIEIQEEAAKARAAAQTRALADFAMAEAKIEAAERAARDRAAALEAQERACKAAAEGKAKAEAEAKASAEKAAAAKSAAEKVAAEKASAVDRVFSSRMLDIVYVCRKSTVRFREMESIDKDTKKPNIF
jgi:membrane protein involved in colicin uptake